MNCLASIPLALALFSAADLCAADLARTNTVETIELEDQFETLHRVNFPTTNVTVLTIADHSGSQQVAGWVQALKQRYSARIAIHGIADVSRVPRLLRSKVRNGFKKLQAHPVMLDWSGVVVQAVGCQRDQANIFVLDREGQVVARFAGPIQPLSWERASAALDSLLAESPEPHASTNSTAAALSTQNHP